MIHAMVTLTDGDKEHTDAYLCDTGCTTFSAPEELLRALGKPTGNTETLSTAHGLVHRDVYEVTYYVRVLADGKPHFTRPQTITATGGPRLLGIEAMRKAGVGIDVGNEKLTLPGG